MKRLFALAFTLLLCLASCQKAPVLTLSSPSNIESSADGSSATISFTANRNWRATSSDSWVTVSPSSGSASDSPVSITVRCNANTTYDDRTATVTISMDELTQTITVRQPANLGIVLPKQVFDLQADAKSIEVEVQANVQYTVSTSVDWIKQTGTKGLTSKTLTFSIEENESYDSREGKITIKPQDSSVQEQVISVKQAQKDALIVEKTLYEMPYGGGEIEIKVEANVDFEVAPGEDWIHHVETKALSGSVIHLAVDENQTHDNREGLVEIAQKDGTLKTTITITQWAEAVDLGIEMTRVDGSSYRVYWASCNLGANSPEEYGDYYAWGEIETKDDYSWSNYKFLVSGDYSYDFKFSKYCHIEDVENWAGLGSPDGKMVLDPEDDVAHVKLGEKWRMPTIEELDALREQCTWTRIENNGVVGYEVKSKRDDNSIFLPATGYRKSVYLEWLEFAGGYLSSSLSGNSAVSWSLFFYYTEVPPNIGQGALERCFGLQVRPVTE